MTVITAVDNYFGISDQRELIEWLMVGDDLVVNYFIAECYLLL